MLNEELLLVCRNGQNSSIAFLELSNYPILKDKGKISMLEAKLKAVSEYEKFRVIQDQTYESDFDREIKDLKP